MPTKIGLESLFSKEGKELIGFEEMEVKITEVSFPPLNQEALRCKILEEGTKHGIEEDSGHVILKCNLGVGVTESNQLQSV